MTGRGPPLALLATRRSGVPGAPLRVLGCVVQQAVLRSEGSESERTGDGVSGEKAFTPMPIRDRMRLALTAMLEVSRTRGL
mmetsp:Transcript_30116/g.73826  ORF Transcript_30116/g.73826 Transcript_30116/m.73826 type:complete len:81 (+) Transcript_30116:826-1068(+)